MSSHRNSFSETSSSKDIDLDHTPVTFGKYKGQTPDEISEHDPSYIVWMYRTVKPTPCSEWLMEVCADERGEDPVGEYDVI